MDTASPVPHLGKVEGSVICESGECGAESSDCPGYYVGTKVK